MCDWSKKHRGAEVMLCFYTYYAARGPYSELYETNCNIQETQVVYVILRTYSCAFMECEQAGWLNKEIEFLEFVLCSGLNQYSMISNNNR